MSHSEIREDPHQYLLSSYEGICENARQTGNLPSHCDTCTISVKMFDIHGLKNMDAIFEDTDIEFVVLERPIEGQWCSLIRAKMTGDWATTPVKHKSDKVECDEVPHSFVQKNLDWYSMLRKNLKTKGRFYTEASFEMVSSCGFFKFMWFLFSGVGLEVDDIVLDSNLEYIFNTC
jgi:hypothetical protein